ncbi:MAG: tetratricopeptide repeat protein [Candidatus Solibacter sp.]|nr:tetratricopeptide repeat protein [Candidatus Solibacter sp.]
MQAIRTFGCLCYCVAAAFSSSLRDEGIAAFHDGRYSLALEKLQQAARTDPADVHARVFLALTQAARNDCKSALPVLTSPGDRADDTLVRLAGLAAAKCWQSVGDAPAALFLLRKLEQRFPKDADVLYSMARFHMKAFNDTTLSMFQRTPASYRVHQLSAEVFEVQGRYDEAITEYRKAIALNPTAPDIHFRLGRAVLMAQQGPAALEQARAEFGAELKLNPEDAACEFQLGQIAYVQRKSDEATRHFQRAIALSPAFPEPLIALAKVHADAKRNSEAIALLERAITLQPGNESAHYALMVAYRNAGDMNKAKAEKATLDRLQKPPEGEFTQFLKKLGQTPPKQ